MGPLPVDCYLYHSCSVKQSEYDIIFFFTIFGVAATL